MQAQLYHNSLVTASVNIGHSRPISLKNYNIFKSIIIASLNRQFCQPITCWKFCIQYTTTNPWFLSNFVVWFVAKLELLVFHSKNSTKNTHFCRHFFNRKFFLKQEVHICRKREVQYLTLVGNDFCSSLRRPRYSLFIQSKFDESTVSLLVSVSDRNSG